MTVAPFRGVGRTSSRYTRHPFDQGGFGQALQYPMSPLGDPRHLILDEQSRRLDKLELQRGFNDISRCCKCHLLLPNTLWDEDPMDSVMPLVRRPPRYRNRSHPLPTSYISQAPIYDIVPRHYSPPPMPVYIPYDPHFVAPKSIQPCIFCLMKRKYAPILPDAFLSHLELIEVYCKTRDPTYEAQAVAAAQQLRQLGDAQERSYRGFEPERRLCRDLSEQMDVILERLLARRGL